MPNEENITLPVGQLKPNSNKYKEQLRDQQVNYHIRESKPEDVKVKIKKGPLEKVGTSEAVLKEKTFMEKLTDAFIAEKPEAVKKYLIEERIVPEIKDFLLEILFDGLSMLVGTKRKSSSKPDYSAISTSGSRYKYASSSNYYANHKPVPNDPGPKNTSEDPCEIIFKIGPDESYNDAKNTAKEVLSNLRDAAIEYDHASVADLYELSGITPKSFTDNNYGWTPALLQYATIKRVREGYALELPKPIPID